MVLISKKLDIKKVIKKRIDLRNDKIIFLNKKTDHNNLSIKSDEKMNDRDRKRVTPDNAELVKNGTIARINELRLDYDRAVCNKIGILIVNLNNIELTKNCINSLLNQINKNFQIYLFDQNSNESGTEEYLNYCENNNIIVIRNKENIPLNHLWSNFKYICPLIYLCFLNNDTVLSNTFIDDTVKILDNESTVGAVIHTTNNPKYLKSENLLNYEILKKPLYQGWDYTIKRELMPDIPKEMLIFGGDDYIFAKLNALNYKIAIVHSSPIIHYKEKTRISISNIRQIQNNDANFFMKLVNGEKLVQIDSTLNHGYSNKYPASNMTLTQNDRCVYTAVIGDYDILLPTHYKRLDNWDYICFTDNKNIKSDFWRIIYIDNENTDDFIKNIKLARFFKTNYYKYLSSYKYVMWMDARITIINNVDEYVNILGNNDIIFLKHPDASSIGQEFKRVLSGNIESLEMVNKIRMRYSEYGYEYNNGLISSGVLLFKNNDKIIKFFKDWWYEIENYSHRDQLSGNFALWRNPEINYITKTGMIGKFFRQLPRTTKPFRF